MAACCLYGAFLVSIFLRKYEILSSYRLSDDNEDEGCTPKEKQQWGLDRLESFIIDGMTCSSCAESIESSLSKRQGIRRANVDCILGRADIVYNYIQISRSQIIEDIGSTGFAATPEKIKMITTSAQRSLGRWNWGEAFTWSLFLLVPILVIDLVPTMILPDRTRQLYMLILGGAMEFGFGLPFFRHSVLAFWKNGLRNLPMDVLISLSTLISYFASLYFYTQHKRDCYVVTSSSLITVLSLSKHIESRFKASITGIVRAFAASIPSHARIFESGYLIPIGMLRRGDLIVVGAKETFPCDGKLVLADNFTSVDRLEVDESFHTGESKPVIKEIGDLCLAGTINSGSGPVLVQIQEGATSRIDEIYKTLLQAQRYKSNLQSTVEDLAAFLVPVTLVLSFLSFVWWSFIGLDQALRVVTATLVVACPCALCLSSPVAILVGTCKSTSVRTQMPT